jgi:hypothetical protein
MIATAFYKGQGLGNQLWVYAATRAAARRQNCNFAVYNSHLFKGKDFLSLDFGNSRKIKRKIPSTIVPEGFNTVYREKSVFHPDNLSDISPFDPNIFAPENHTFLEGAMQSENYLLDSKNEIIDWFQADGDEFDGCVINLRGGEFKTVKNHFLSIVYYENAIKKIREIDPQCEFLVVTDDIELSKKYFPNFAFQSSGGVRIIARKFYFSPKSFLIGKDFVKIQKSKYLILSNSSFSWWGAWTNKRAKFIIAPKYWARHNVSDGYWSQGDSLTRGWEWLDRGGHFWSYDKCLLEIENFRIPEPGVKH